MEPDFSGYATKANLECSDGLTIAPEAFAHMFPDRTQRVRVPLVWSHIHRDLNNILGYAELELKHDGVFAHGYFNNTKQGQDAREMVRHGELSWLSIFATDLVKQSKRVMHGLLREVSLVLAGANPGARIDPMTIRHSEGWDETLDDEAVIFSGLKLEHGFVEHAEDKSDDSDEDDDDEETVAEVLSTLNEKQSTVVGYLVQQAVKKAQAGDADDDKDTTDKVEHSSDEVGIDTDVAEDTVEHSADDSEESDDSQDESLAHNQDDEDSSDSDTHQEGIAHMNFFDKDGQAGSDKTRPTLTHDQFATIISTAKKPGNTLRSAVLAHMDEFGIDRSELAHAGDYGIDDIEFLFPEARNVSNTPDFISRQMEWVTDVLAGIKKSPFAKVRTIHADITEPEARAKGYIKGSVKKEEVFKLLRRTTGPATVYKKQKLDRDDMIDITDMDVVAFLWGEMRLMINEAVAEAILVGDNRGTLDEDKIKDPEGAIDGTGIRSILNDSDLYAIKHNLPANVTPQDAVKGLRRARAKYRGSGRPTMYISENMLIDIMLEQDKFGRDLYADEAALAAKLRVDKIVPVTLFDDHPTLFCIVVNLSDYQVGTNKGGELTQFNQFDIDVNQEKFLLETRLSGGLTKPYSAIVVFRAQGDLATPQAPSFDGGTDTITIPVVTGVSYFDTATEEELTGDVVITKETEVEARADEGYYLAPNTTRSWTFAP